MTPATRSATRRAGATVRRLALLAAAVLGLGATATRVDARPRDRVAQASPDKRARIKQRLRTLRDDALIAEIPLDPAAAARLRPVLARHDETRARFQRDARRLRRALAAAIDAGEPVAIDRAIDQLMAHRRTRAALDEARMRDLRAVLSPAQAARLFLTLPTIERRLQAGIGALSMDDRADALAPKATAPIRHPGPHP